MTLSRTGRLAVGFVLFQAAWFAAVIGAAQGHAALGSAVLAVVVFALLGLSTNRPADLRLVAIAVVIGAPFDGTLAYAGIVRYASPGPVTDWAPLWILGMWALFAPMLREPLSWLHGRPLLAAVVGGVGGPLSYAAAERLGACVLPERSLALLVLGAGWALIVPVLLSVAQRLERDATCALAAAPRQGTHA